MLASNRWWIRLCIVAAALGAALLSWFLTSPTPAAGVPASAAAMPYSGQAKVLPAATSAPHSSPAVPVTLPCANGAPREQTLLPYVVEQASARVADKLSHELAASVDPHEQALGYYLSALSRAAQAKQAYRMSHPGCVDDTGCTAAMMDESVRAQDDDLLALTRLAAGGRDATVYGLAQAQCMAQPKDHRTAACRQLSPAQWEQLAPDRLEPRLAAAQEAWLNGDQTQLYLALYKVAQFAGSFGAGRPADGLRKTPAMALLNAGEQELASMIIVESGQMFALDGIVSSYCSGDKLTDANQRQLCNSLAAKMVEPASTVRQVMAGAILGRKLGWTVERFDNARREAKAVNRYLIKELGGTSANTCGAWRTQGKIARGIVYQGELATYRHLIPTDQMSADPTLHQPLINRTAQPIDVSR